MIPKGRIQLAVTQSLEKAMAKYPWATAFITRKCGVWCFEFRQDRDAVLPGETPGRRTRNNKKRRRESL